jgi:ketosteroid isomerase-like protein
MLPFLLAMLLAGPFGGPSTAPISPLPDARFVQDLHEKNVEDVLTLYSADAVFVNPDGSVAHSGPELRKLYEQVTATLDSDLHLHPSMVEQMGRSVKESGSYTETLRHRDTGKVEEVKGTYLFVGRREADGQYRYTRMEWH